MWPQVKITKKNSSNKFQVSEFTLNFIACQFGSILVTLGSIIFGWIPCLCHYFPLSGGAVCCWQPSAPSYKWQLQQPQFRKQGFQGADRDEIGGVLLGLGRVFIVDGAQDRGLVSQLELDQLETRSRLPGHWQTEANCRYCADTGGVSPMMSFDAYICYLRQKLPLRLRCV